MRKNMLRSENLSDFCRQIAVLSKAGITLEKAMTILKDTSENRKIAGIYGKLEEKIRSGQAIGNSMEELGVFTEMMVNMFRAAEASGQIEMTANYLADHYRKEYRMETQIRTATLYPKVLCIVSGGIMLFIFLAIMPMVESLYGETEVPMLTQCLISLSNIIREKWKILGIILLSFLLLGPVFMSMIQVQIIRDYILFHTPVIKNYMKTIYSARFARGFSSLYGSGVAMVDCLRIASRTLGSKYLELQFLNVVQAVERGSSLSNAIEKIDGMEMKLSAAMRVGEESGKLDTLLLNLAEGYEYDSETAATRLVSLIEPVLIIFIGLVVSVIVLGIMIPMWRMYEFL